MHISKLNPQRYIFITKRNLKLILGKPICISGFLHELILNIA